MPLAETITYGNCRIREIRLPVETEEAGIEPVIIVVIEVPGAARGRIKPLLSHQTQKRSLTVSFEAET